MTLHNNLSLDTIDVVWTARMITPCETICSLDTSIDDVLQHQFFLPRITLPLYCVVTIDGPPIHWAARLSSKSTRHTVRMITRLGGDQDRTEHL